MTTDLVLDTLEHAIWTRRQAGVEDLTGLVHHTDAGSQGEFKWSSQHLDQEVHDGKKAAGCRSCAASEDAFAGQVGFPASG
jgi:putative transposase